MFGVVGGSPDAPETAYLEASQPITDELIQLAKPVSADEVFRFAAPCACSNCGHFDNEQSRCRLAQKIVRWVPMVSESLPVCSIRAHCRWWQQEGRQACMRCPQVVTRNHHPSAAMRDAADPERV